MSNGDSEESGANARIRHLTAKVAELESARDAAQSTDHAATIAAWEAKQTAWDAVAVTHAETIAAWEAKQAAWDAVAVTHAEDQALTGVGLTSDEGRLVARAIYGALPKEGRLKLPLWAKSLAAKGAKIPLGLAPYMAPEKQGQKQSQGQWRPPGDTPDTASGELSSEAIAALEVRVAGGDQDARKRLARALGIG